VVVQNHVLAIITPKETRIDVVSAVAQSRAGVIVIQNKKPPISGKNKGYFYFTSLEADSQWQK
jgi:hypothetical protein